MFSLINLIDSSSDEEQEVVNMRVLKKNLRDKSNPLELPNNEFHRAFRVNKEVFRYLLDVLQLQSGTYRTFIPPIQQLAIALNVLGGAGYQHQIGRDLNAPASQSKISKILSKVFYKMESKLCPMMIKFNISEETKLYFYNKFNIPGVIGCVDGTHVMILKPSVNEHIYFNRKCRHSINAMVICNEKYEILAINPRYGGAAHDSFVWRQSNERSMLEELWSNSRRNCWLLGDSGYPLEPFLMTPYRASADNTPEALFNTVHSKARSIVERCIGVVKTRWRIILEERKCRYSPEKVGRIINICAALHNICVNRNVELPEDFSYSPSEEISENNSTSQPRTEAVKIRDNIRDSLQPL